MPDATQGLLVYYLDSYYYRNTGGHGMNKTKRQKPDNQMSNRNLHNQDTGTAQQEGKCTDDKVSEGIVNGGDNSAGVTEGEQPELTAQEEAAIWRDKYMRLSAEFDNFRKRTLKEKMDLVISGGEEVIKALLPVLDDMDRALESVRNASDVDAVRTGTELIAHKLKNVLETRGVKEIEALGLELDTDFHEAVAKIPAPDGTGKGCIVDVVQKGYKLKDKVVRHAKVVVGE